MIDYKQYAIKYKGKIKDFEHERLKNELVQCEAKMLAACTLHFLDLADYYAEMIQFIKTKLLAFEINLKHNQN